MQPGTTAANQIPLTDQQLDAFSRAFREDAQGEELSGERVRRFEAWTLAFLSWCNEKVDSDGADRARSCRIGDFQVALRGRPEISRKEAQEAMDALGFLFGVAGETRSMLRSAGFSLEGPTSGTKQDAAEADSGTEIQTLQAGWWEEGDLENRAAGRGVGPSQGTPSETSASSEHGSSVSRPTSQEDASSTAKAFVRAFQDELESVHASGSDPGDTERRGSGNDA